MKQFLAYMLFCIILFASCSGNHKKQTDNTLRLAIYDVTFDHYIFPPTIAADLEKSVSSIFYDGLFKINPVTLSVENALCKSWDVDNTGLVYIIKLDSTAMFNADPCFTNGNTRHVNAYDVKYTFHILANPKYGISNFTNTVYHIKGAKEYYSLPDSTRDTSRIDGIEIIDTYTLKITLDKPSPRFIQNLAHPAAAIIPYESVEEYGDKSTVGVGPFSYIVDSTKFIFVKNPNYYKFDEKGNRLPYLDTITLTQVPDFESTIDLFTEGEIDAMLMVAGSEIASVLKQIPENIDYEITEANISNLRGSGKMYNIIRSDIKNLYTNKLNILDFSLVYRRQ